MARLVEEREEMERKKRQLEREADRMKEREEAQRLVVLC